MAEEQHRTGGGGATAGPEGTGDSDAQEHGGGGGGDHRHSAVTGDGAAGGSGSWLCCLPCYWLRRNNSVHKASLTVATLLVTSLLVASPVLFLISAVPASDTPPRDCRIAPSDDGCMYAAEGSEVAAAAVLGVGGPECTEPQCLAAADRVLSTVDPRTDPCRDFYQYSCGRWRPGGGGGGSVCLGDMQAAVDAHIQQLLAGNSTARGGTFRKLGQFYKSCVDLKNKPVSTAPMFSLLEQLGGYLPPGALGPTDLTPLLARLMRVNGAPLVDVLLDRDPARPSDRPAVLVDVPPLTGHTLHMDLLLAFLPQKMAVAQRVKEAQTILLFSTMLSKVYPRQAELAGTFPVAHNLTRLQAAYPFVGWAELFDEVLAWNSTGQNVYVRSPGYMSGVTAVVGRFPKRVVHNALLLVYARDILQGLLNVTGRDQRRFCTRLTAATFGQAVGALYARQYPARYVRHLEHRAAGLLAELKAALAARMRAAPWLDGSARLAALVKLDMLRGRFVTWHDSSSNDTLVAGIMDNVDIDPGDFFASVINRYRQMRSASLDPGAVASVLPFAVSARYEPRENAIVIPLALLVQPNFRSDVPACLPYATVGSVLGHELLHGFDVRGSRHDGRGLPSDWLGPAARLGLEARVDCLARQYTHVFHRKAQFDCGENMADIGALQMAHQTWRANQRAVAGRLHERLTGVALAPAQLFHVAAAQTYCSVDTVQPVHVPHPDRVNSIMMNSPSFSEAFNCPAGSPMNPMKKCSTW